MALVTKGTVSLADGLYVPQIQAIAGEAIALGDLCYIASADGLAYRTDATAANEAAEVAGIAAKATQIGQSVTLYGYGAKFRYGSGLTPGNIFYAAATAGRMDDAVTVGDSMGVAVVLTANTIMITRATPAPMSAVSDGALNGTKVANVANVNVIGGLPLLFRVTITNVASHDVDVVTTHKIRVLDVWAVKTGGAGGAADTIQVKETANNITDALDMNKADNTITRAATIDDAEYEIGAGGTLRVSSVNGGAGNCAAEVYILAIRVA